MKMVLTPAILMKLNNITCELCKYYEHLQLSISTHPINIGDVRGFLYCIDPFKLGLIGSSLSCKINAPSDKFYFRKSMKVAVKMIEDDEKYTELWLIIGLQYCIRHNFMDDLHIKILSNINKSVKRFGRIIF